MSKNNLLQPSHKKLDGFYNSENNNNHDANEKTIILKLVLMQNLGDSIFNLSNYQIH
jgi:hypothetical protein